MYRKMHLKRKPSFLLTTDSRKSEQKHREVS